jgi:hypothetical protein
MGRVRGLLAASAAALVVLAGGISADAASGGLAHARHVAPPAAPSRFTAAAAAKAASNSVRPNEFTTTDNPVTLDQPVKVPRTEPVTVTIADQAAFGNAPSPYTSTVTLPKGRWAKVVLDITGSEKGRQYDRLLNVYDGAEQIFLGVTPEPTAAGITWHLTKDITGYLPLFAGTRTFSTYVDNYLSSVDTGIPVITAKLLFYPAASDGHSGYAAARPASLTNPSLAGDAINQTGPASPAGEPGVPTTVVPLVSSGNTTDFGTVGAGKTASATVSLPGNVTTATLDVYAVGQSSDEFWWGLSPSFREIEVSVDGKPAGVVWPYPYVYTGGVNPLIWRPLTGIHTMDIPSYRLDLTPFAGLLSAAGPHTVTLSVAGNAGYWLAGGSLLLTTGGKAVTGSVTSDTLSFPTTSAVTTANALGSSSQQAVTESASASYAIAGTILQGGRTWTDTLTQDLGFSNDQANINPSCSGPCYQWVHQETTSAASETISGGPDGDLTRHDQASWTTDAPNGYLTDSTGNDFLLPASVSQQLTDVASAGEYRTSLSESVMGYGELEEDSGTPTIADGDTTGTITVRDGDAVYERTVVTHGGQVVQDLTGLPPTWRHRLGDTDRGAGLPVDEDPAPQRLPQYDGQLAGRGTSRDPVMPADGGDRDRGGRFPDHEFVPLAGVRSGDRDGQRPAVIGDRHRADRWQGAGNTRRVEDPRGVHCRGGAHSGEPDQPGGQLTRAAVGLERRRPEPDRCDPQMQAGGLGSADEGYRVGRRDQAVPVLVAPGGGIAGGRRDRAAREGIRVRFVGEASGGRQDAGAREHQRAVGRAGREARPDQQRMPHLHARHPGRRLRPDAGVAQRDG